MTRKLFVVAFVAALAVSAAVAFAAMRAQRGQKSGERASTAGASESKSGAARVPVVVELFTSEGCSSCPPADALLGRLDATQPVEGAEVIPLAMHVDYWNYLGWADPYSAHEFSERQGEYAAAYKKDGVYTPQMIVDGVKEFSGGNERAALESVAAAAREKKAELTITHLPRRDEGDDVFGLSVGLDKFPKQTEGDPVYVLLAVTESGLSSDVARGENSGRRLTHVGVTRAIQQLGILPEAVGQFKVETGIVIKKDWRRENLRAVVFAQERGTRRVLAAGSLKLFD
ncbi:MAG TPA: DUF1223 domain-containing protein [Pyrinomonadaceae bacterium]|jgi:hypothetical protein|nr:DUF1223 domain-containing protein [Pyrinomonadaceae bacterium]